MLLVEDEDAIRDTVRRILSRKGYRVLEARNADEAIAVLEKSSPIDLLVTDVVMPNVSGPELARRLKRERPSLPVLFMSGYTFNEISREALGPKEHLLTKPFTPAELLAAVALVYRAEVR